MTAATVVSATGALLLLAAAATFLAVSWDSLGLTARVAAVGTGTALAIVGGARLRRTLPAVGAVVFHLGALLVPVDALGLALQLDVGPAGTWIAVGGTTVVALSVAAHAGSSRVLAAGALAGVPILATGLGLAEVAAAPLATAVAAVAALVVTRIDRRDGRDERDVHDEATARGPRIVLGLAAPVLAVAAVAGPLLVAAASAVTVAGGGVPMRAAATAGWLPASWTQPALAGAIAVVALAAAAVLRRSARWASAVPVVIALVAVTLLLPGDAPRLARLLPWPMLFLAVEAVALASSRDRILRDPLARTAAVSEILAAFAVPGALWTVATGLRAGIDPFGGGGEAAVATGDPVLAAVAAVTAVAWSIAVIRRGVVDAAAVAAAAAGVAVAAAAITLVAPGSGLGVALCLGAMVATTAVRGGGGRGVVTSGAALVLGVTGLVGTWSVAVLPASASSRVAAGLLAVTAALIAGVIAGRVAAHAEVAAEGPAAAVLLLPVTIVAAVIGATAIDGAFGAGAATLYASALLLACATVLGRVPVAADALRVLAAGAVLLAGTTGPLDLDDAVTMAPAALLVAVVLGAEAIRCRRPWLLTAAGPVLVRAVAGIAFAATASGPATGVVLLVLAVAAAIVAIARPGLRAAGIVTAVTAGIASFTLLSLSPTAFAWGTVGVGVVVIVAGLLARQVPVAHVGGVVTILGLWQVLALEGVTAVDVWLLAPALQLWLVGLPARRGGRVSSWVADVPPLAVVVVPALLERLAGGGGWHAALAGSLAVVAVVGGGVGRHAGPLVVGVVAVVAVVAIETLAVVAAVPTWAWLTAGGVVLLVAGALIERTGGAPVATVRRLVDVVAERFD